MAMPPACRYPDASACGKCASPLKTVFNDIWSILDGKVDMYNLDQDIFGPGIEIEKKRKSPTIAYERITVPIADDRNNGYIRNKKEEGIDVGIETVLRDTARYCISDGTNQIGSFSIDTNDLHLDTPLGDFYINEALALTTLGGTINKIPKFTSASAIGDSSLTDDGTKLINSYTKFYLGGTTAFDAVVIGDISGFQLKNGNESSFLPLTTESLFTKIGITTYAGLGVTGLELNNTDITWGFVSSTKNTGIKRTSDANLKVTDGSSGYGTLDAGTLKESGTSLTDKYAEFGSNETISGDWSYSGDQDFGLVNTFILPRQGVGNTDGTFWYDASVDDKLKYGNPTGSHFAIIDNTHDFTIDGQITMSNKLDLSSMTGGFRVPTSSPMAAGGEVFYDIDSLYFIDNGLEKRRIWHNGDFEIGDYLTSVTAAATYQPLDSDLTAIAALATTTAGRKFLTMPTPATYDSIPAIKSDGTFVQYSVYGSSLSAAIPLTNGSGKLDASFGGSASTLATLNASGKVVELPADAELSAIAGLTSAADKIPYFTGSGTAAVADFPSAMRTFLTTPTSANLAALVSDDAFSLSDAELGAIAGLVSAADKVPYFTGSGTANLSDFKTIARAIGGLATPAANGVIVAGSDGSVTTFDAKSGASTILNLTAAADKIPYYTGASSSALADFPSAMRTFLTTPSSANFAALVSDDAFSLSDAELGAIAGLTSAADRLPYFTGSGTAALATYTAAARTFSALDAAQGEIVYSSGTNTWARLSPPTADAEMPANILTHPGGSSAGNPVWKQFKKIIKTDNESCNNAGGGSGNHTSTGSTLTNDAALSVTLRSGKVYIVKLIFLCTVDATPDFKWAWAFSGTLNSMQDYYFLHDSGNGTAFGARNTTLTTTRTILVSANRDNRVEVWAIFDVSGDGTLNWQWAQNTAGANVDTVYKGSYMEVFEAI